MARTVVAYLKLFRFPLVFTAIADSAAGYLLVSGAGRDPRVLVLLAVASAGLYFFGMALNDIADRDRDKLIAPQRVLPSGRISLRGAIGATNLAALVSGAAVVAVPGATPARLLAWGGVVACIVAYDVFLKFPPVMGLVRAGNFLLGVFCANPGAEPPGAGLVGFSYAPMFVLALAPFVYVTALTFVSTLEEGEVRRPMVRVGAVAMAAAAILPEFLVPFRGGVSVYAWVISGMLLGLIAARAGNAKDRRGVMLLVRDGIGGIILLDTVILLSAHRVSGGLFVLTLIVPAFLCLQWFKKLA